MTALPEPPYRPDLAPCHPSLFSKRKSMVKECRLDTTEDIKINFSQVLKKILKEAYQHRMKF